MTIATPSRRTLLAGITAALAATTAPPALAAISAPAAAPPATEAPELLELGARLADLTVKIRAAHVRIDEARAAFDRLKPALPREIMASKGAIFSTLLRGVDGQPVKADGGRDLIDVFSSREVRAHIIRHDVPRNTKEGRQLRRIARLAQKHEREHEAAVQACGFDEASDALSGLQIELQCLAEAAAAIKPVTSEGLAVYAAFFIACTEERQDDHGMGVALAKAHIR